MAVSYNKLWKSVNLAILDRICRVLGCDLGDIVEHLDEPETADS